MTSKCGKNKKVAHEAQHSAQQSGKIDVPRGFTLVFNIVNVISMINKVKDNGKVWLLY